MLLTAAVVVVSVVAPAQAKPPPPTTPPTTSSANSAPISPVGVEPTPIPVPVPTVKPTVVVVDDRIVKDQAPGPFLTRTVAELQRRRDFRVVPISEARKKLDARSNN